MDRPTETVAHALRALALWLLGLCAALPAAAEPFIFRISTENAPTHFQTRVVQRFADALAIRAQGRLQVEFRHSAQLFRDQDVVRAINEGKVEMAVPGNWQLDRYDPYVSVLSLPMLMGRSVAEHRRFRDGTVGKQVSAHLEQSLQVVVPGRWIDLGYANVFTTRKAISRYQDMAGLRIRIAGGAAIAAQLSEVGALPALVPWPDLPNVLQQGHLDGLLTTYETVASARLWDMGVQRATANQAYFAQYIPMVSRSYWNSLPEDLRQAIRSSWESVVDAARAQAESAQQQARRTLEAHGVKVIDLDPAALQAWRQQATKNQSALAKSLGVPAQLLNEAERQFGPDR